MSITTKGMQTPLFYKSSLLDGDPILLSSLDKNG